MINKILTTIKNIFIQLFHKLTFRDYVIILLCMIALGLYIKSNYYEDKSIQTPLVIYDSDSLDIYKNRVKDLYVAKQIYVQNVKDLQKQNCALANEVKNLKDNPLVVTKTETKVRIEKVYAKSDTIINGDSIYNLQWHIDEPKGYYTVNGITDVRKDFSSFTTRLDSFKLDATLTLDMIEDKSGIRLIGKTDNPYISISNMDGVIFDPTKSKYLKKYYKQKKWSIGPTIGYGLSKDLKLTPYVGIGISYGIIQF